MTDGAMTDGFDVVVVGAGSAGCVLADRLSQEPDRRVLLVEAGPHHAPGDLPESVRSIDRRLDPVHDWGDEASTVGGRRLPYTRGRLAGGGSAVNATMAFRCLPGDADGWGHGWSWSVLEPAFEDVEARLPLARYRREEWTPLQERFASRCRELGFPEVHDHNAPGTGGGVGPIPMNRQGRDRVSAATAFLAPALPRRNLTVRADTEVDRVLLRGRRAVGVALAGGEEVPAPTVVVAAGVVGSPRLLLRSGVEHPQLGRNLSDHVSVPLPLPPALGDRGPTLQVALRHGDSLDRMLFPVGGPAPTIYAAPQTVDARGEVTPDEIVWPFVGDPGCQRALREGVRLAWDVAGGGAAVDLDVADDGSVDAYVRAEHRAFLHGCGTAAIGSVVDGGLAVEGYEGLLVCDASVIPTVPRVNPNLTVMALAHRAGSFL